MTSRYKVLNVNACGKHLEAIRVVDTVKGTKYELRIIWFDEKTCGFRRSKLREYSFFNDVLAAVCNFYGFRMYEMSIEEIKERFKEA